MTPDSAGTMVNPFGGPVRPFGGGSSYNIQDAYSTIPTPAPVDPAAGMSEFGKGWEYGKQQMQALGYGSVGLVGDIAGIDSLRDFGYEGYLRNMEEASPYAGKVGDIRDIESFETAAQWGAHTLGSLLPQAMLSLGTGGAGSFVGKRVLGTVVANGAKSAIAAAEQSLIKQGLSAELAREAATKAVASRLGATLGVTGAMWSQEAGGMYARDVETHGIENTRPIQDAVFGLASAMVDVIMGAEGSILRKVTGVPVAREVERSFRSALVRDLPKVMLQEGFTEGIQEAVAAANANIQDSRAWITPDDYWDIINSAAAGAIGGLGFAPVSTVVDRLKTAEKNTAESNDPSLSTKPQFNAEDIIKESAVAAGNVEAATEIGKTAVSMTVDSIGSKLAETQQKYAGLVQQLSGQRAQLLTVLGNPGSDPQVRGQAEAALTQVTGQLAKAQKNLEQVQALAKKQVEKATTAAEKKVQKAREKRAESEATAPPQSPEVYKRLVDQAKDVQTFVNRQSDISTQIQGKLRAAITELEAKMSDPTLSRATVSILADRLSAYKNALTTEQNRVDNIFEQGDRAVRLIANNKVGEQWKLDKALNSLYGIGSAASDIDAILRGAPEVNLQELRKRAEKTGDDLLANLAPDTTLPNKLQEQAHIAAAANELRAAHTRESIRQEEQNNKRRERQERLKQFFGGGKEYWATLGVQAENKAEAAEFARLYEQEAVQEANKVRDKVANDIAAAQARAQQFDEDNTRAQEEAFGASLYNRDMLVFPPQITDVAETTPPASPFAAQPTTRNMVQHPTQYEAARDLANAREQERLAQEAELSNWWEQAERQQFEEAAALGSMPEGEFVPGRALQRRSLVPTSVQAEGGVQQGLPPVPETGTVHTSNLAREVDVIKAQTQAQAREQVGATKESVDTAKRVTSWIKNTLKQLPVLADKVEVISNPDILARYQKGAVAAFENGRILLFAPNITSKEQAIRAVVHEGVVHYGLRTLFTDRQRDHFLKLVYDSYKDSAAWANHVGKNPYYASLDPLSQAEEFVARIAERKKVKQLLDADEKSVFAKVKNFIKQVLNRLGIRKLSEDDIMNVLQASALHLAQDKNSPEYKSKVDALLYSLPESATTGPRTFLEAEQQREDAYLSMVDKVGRVYEDVIKAGQVVTPDGKVRRHSSVDWLLEKFGDKLRRLQVVQRALIKQGGKITPHTNAYRKHEMMSNKVSSRIGEIQKEFIDPNTKGSLMYFVNKLVPTFGTFEKALAAAADYATALHALERNAVLRERIKRMPHKNITQDMLKYMEAPSGWTDAEAHETIRKYQGDPNMEGVVRVMQYLNTARLELLRQYNLFDKDVIDQWEQTYKYYVPLKNWDEAIKQIDPGYAAEHARAGISVGEWVPSKRAKGRDTLPQNPIIHTIVQYEDAIRMGERTVVGRSLLNLIKDNPAPDLWKVIDSEKPKYKVTSTGDGELVFRKVKHEFSGTDVPVVTIIDEEGARVRVAIFDKDLARGLKDENLLIAGPVVRQMGVFTQMMAKASTTLSLPFILGNPIRDVQTALLNLGSVIEEHKQEFAADIKKIRPQLAKDLVPAFKALWREGKGLAPRNQEEAGWYNAIKLYKDSGAETSMYGLANFEDTYTRLRKMARQPHAARDLVITAGTYLHTLSDILENMTRLSVFKNMYSVYLKHGMSPEVAQDRAGNVALNLTVNFTKKGAWAPVMNALYMFSSASIAGNIRMMQNIVRPTSTREQNIKRVAKYLGGFMAGHMALAALCRAVMGDDDDGVNKYDKIPDYVKSQNLILPSPFSDGGYIKIPMALGYHIFWATSDAFDQVINGRKRPVEAAVGTVKTFFDAFSFVGGADEGWTALVPTIFRPVFQIATNRNFAGQPIVPEGAKDKPDSQKFWGTADPVLRAFAEALNSAFGGSKTKSGYVDVSPETIEHLLLSYTGGVGRVVWDSYKAVDMALTPGKEFEYTKSPVVKRFIGQVGASDTQQLYSKVKKEIMASAGEYKLAYKEGVRGKELAEIRENSMAALKAEQGLSRIESALTKIRKAETDLAIKHSVYSEEYNVRKRMLQEQKEMYMKRLIKLAESAGVRY